ncbi:flagellar basal body P-ring formation protein FlgA [Leeia sp. TBRC 13508]|uniref:Flagella basal body P-ring formation protein FlgA n=1 Tax=Leeia speluncae TaxID=2884804 RepID=A0ABS8D1Q3_9NEIS|nr:flagellar basal body P-ring formation chaperone FlgA [Leeia speluncae]MCB6182124.1 flagellar basal body P-ring formation protein FlgA [Leeia speluncae]
MIKLNEIRSYLLLLLLIPFTCLAVPRQDLSQLHSQVFQYLSNQLQNKPGKVSIDVSPLDKRIVVAKCDAPEASLPNGSKLIGRTTVNVKCNSPAKWSLIFQAYISIQSEVVVSSRPLPQGKTLSAEDISLVTRELADLPNTVITSPDQAIGRMLVSAIPAGNILRNEHFRAAFAITQNQIVRVIAQSNEFHIETQGKSLNNALAGQNVNVRTTSGQMIQGVAQADGTVLIDLN